jgi:GT2 family glycosyltransferase
MDTLAPPVVAVVVAHDPGPWFEETLASLASQDYAELSVLILDADSEEDLTARVAAVLPTAFVRRFEENRGFGATVSEALTMVDGADYFLVCHDDVALFPDAVHLMVEEAFRSNAGIVTPKVVSWDDPQRLIHVGMMADKGGSVVDRVQPHEIDHGQHDAVRDVFVAPGGATLIRADLFEELGGFDPTIVAMGEDLDLSWRAQVVGARIIVAPDARVRHLEVLAAGSRPIDPSLVDRGTDPLADAGSAGDTADDTATLARTQSGSDPPVTLQELQRRHELLAVFTCYGRFHLLRVVPQVVVLAIAEVIVAELAGNRARARAVVRAWRWNLARLPTTRARRKELKAHRRLSDKEIRVLQVGGSARLSSYFRRVFQQGFHGAHADELAAAELSGESALRPSAPPADLAFAGGTTASATSGPVAGATGPVAPARGRLSGQVRLTVWLIAGAAVLIGSRGVLTGRLPVVGQFVPFPSWTATLSQFAAGWHPSGVGTTAPASPGLALTGLVGTVLLGAMGLTQKVLIFACIPVGVWGVVRLLRPFGSQRAALVAGLAYLAVAVPYNALALGRWGALVVYAGGPWVLARLFRATGSSPYAAGTEPSGTVDRTDRSPAPSELSGSMGGRVTAWTLRHPQARSAIALGLIEAVLIAFVPAAAIVVVLAALALVVPSALLGDGPSTRRALSLALASTGVAAAICLPWVIGALSAGRGAIAVFGVPMPASSAPSWSSLLRFAAGPIGGSPLSWGFALAAVAPLVLARGDRFRWAVRFWSMALLFWLAAWVIGRGWTGSLAVDPLILLAPAAAAVAAAIGLGVAAFEEDLRAAEFGWRQLVTVAATVVVVLGALPTAVSALPGRWDLPLNDFSQSVAWMNPKAAGGAFRVLWLGDANAIYQGSWAAGDGLAYATSENGGPDARWLWNAAGPGPAAGLASAVTLARAGGTDQLGRLLAPAGVRYVALLTSLAPEISGEQNPTEYPVPADLAPALARQLDLSPVLSGTGITVYVNNDWLPQRAELPTGASVPDSPRPDPLVGTPGSGVVAGAVPVLAGPVASRSYAGPLAPGTVLAAVAPAGRWSLTGPTGRPARRSSSFGWAARFGVTAAGPATLRFEGGLVAAVSFAVSVVVWLAALALLMGRNLGRPWARVRSRRRPRDEAGGDADGSDGSQVAVEAPVGETVP